MPNPKYTGELELGEACLTVAEEPSSVDEALGEAPWRAAMEEEMRCIICNNTWELSALPAGHRAIGLKWVFKVKRDPDGNVVKHKARLVAKGYHRGRVLTLMRCSRRWRGSRPCISCSLSQLTEGGSFTTWTSSPLSSM
jgi:hypothetical protein